MTASRARWSWADVVGAAADALADLGERDAARREARCVEWTCDTLERLVQREGVALPIGAGELDAALWGEERELLALERRDGTWHVRAR